MTVKADRISMALNTSGFTKTIALDISKFFWQDRAHYWSFLPKLSFTVRFFFSDWEIFFELRTMSCLKAQVILWVCHFLWKTSEFYLQPSFFYLLSAQHMIKHLTCCNKQTCNLSCDLILKIEFIRKLIHISSATFWFWIVKI